MAQDGLIIVLSILLAVVLAKTDSVERLLTATEGAMLLGSFIAGLFFTSVFTTAPAIIALGEIARDNPIWLTALFGAMGSVIGDLIIFQFVRDRLSTHLMELLKHNGVGKRVKALFRFKFFRGLTFLAGGLIIASPLPDELGISLLGFSKIRTSWFIPLSFTFNFLGIVLIGLIANAL